MVRQQNKTYPSLSDRQEAVFTAILQQYVTSARAVGSRNLSKRLPLDLSPATVRNVMADLEEMGLLSHPHTSAGRVPTTLGYGYYVDAMMNRVELTDNEQKEFSKALDDVMIGDINEVLDRAGETLARISTLISVVLSPRNPPQDRPGAYRDRQVADRSHDSQRICEKHPAGDILLAD